MTKEQANEMWQRAGEQGNEDAMDLAEEVERLHGALSAAQSTIKLNCDDWATDHTHLQEACIKAGIPKEKVDGYGVPGIMDLADMIVAELERVKEQVRHSRSDALKYSAELVHSMSRGTGSEDRAIAIDEARDLLIEESLMPLPEPPKGDAK